MKYLKVKGYDNNTVIVDDEDYDRLVKFNWHSANGGIRRCIGHSKIRSLANEVMKKTRVLFDHIDRNPANNRKNNLREASRSQNNMNQSKRLFCSSKYKGVSWYKRSSKWKADIRFNGKTFHLGYFLLEEDAARAYDKAALEFFKQFANINFK